MKILVVECVLEPVEKNVLAHAMLLVMEHVQYKTQAPLILTKKTLIKTNEQNKR